GQQVGVSVVNNSGSATAWVGLYATGQTDNNQYLGDQYLNGDRLTPPSSAMSSAQLTFTPPTTPGTYHFRLFATNVGYTLIATSPTVTVVAAPSGDLNTDGLRN